MNTYHKSVMTKEVINGLNLKQNGIYIDATFGGGGHSKAILQAEPTCKVIAIDWDTNAIEQNATSLEKKFGIRFKIVWSNFVQLYTILKKEKINQVNGILADFGTAQHQFFHKKGFSFSQDSPLDMRMSPAHQQITAENVLSTFSERELSKIFFELGEEPKSRIIAKAIVEQRKQKPFKTTRDLAKLVEKIVKTPHLKIHPATKIFQALRIFINNELDNIKVFLLAAINALAPEGRIVCISFHSLEDRIVKTIFREQQEKLHILTKKPITPSEKEISQNPSARSAKMRIAEKK